MAKLVTRTIITTKVNALAGGDGKKELFPIEVTMSGKLDNKRAAKVAAKMYDTEEHKILQVVSVEVNEALYGMTEETFIANAEVLPPRKVKTENN